MTRVDGDQMASTLNLCTECKIRSHQQTIKFCMFVENQKISHEFPFGLTSPVD